MNKILQSAVERIESFGVGRSVSVPVERMEMYEASAVRIKRVLIAFAHHCYAQVGDDYVNLDGTRIARGVVVPWSSEGKPRRQRKKAKTALTPTERRVARAIIKHLSPKLWYYHERTRGWYVNLHAYHALALALAAIDSVGIDGEMCLRLSRL